MKIRLIIPQCTNWNGFYCHDASEINGFDNRIGILNDSMQDATIDIVVTSHNYLSFYPASIVNPIEFIQNRIINNCLSGIPYTQRKPIILGYDLLTENINFNPYQTGIDALVCFIGKNSENRYTYKTHIWECWSDKGECSTSCIISQNNQRVFEYNSKKFGLLSCGDIARYCHDDGNSLPQVDIYVDLSHKSLTGRTSQRSIPPKIINEWSKANLVLVTQQVNNVKNYKIQNSYPYIFSAQNLQTNTKITQYTINGETGVYVDIEITWGSLPKPSKNPVSGNSELIPKGSSGG